MKRILSLAFCIFYLAAVSEAAEIRLPPGRYMLKHAGSSRCLDITDAIRDNGLPLQIWDCNHSLGQTFQIEPTGGNGHKIISSLNEKSVEIKNASKEGGAPVQQWEFSGTENQTFIIESTRESQTYVIRPSHSRLSLASKTKTNASKLIQSSLTDPAFIHWQIVPAKLPAPTPIRVQERQLWVDGKPFIMKGVCYNPVRKGQAHPEGLLWWNPSEADLRTIDKDLRMMKEMGANTIRTYEPILNNRVLDLIRQHDLKLIVPVFNYHLVNFKHLENVVSRLKNHPNVVMWEIGNEWNFNYFYDQPEGAWGLGYERSKAFVKMAAAAVRTLDTKIPISTVYWGVPKREFIEEMTDIDIWATNIYAGLSFNNFFNKWKELSTKPVYIAEYGADAVNHTTIDYDAQTKAVVTLSRELLNNLSGRDANHTAIGGTIFEWNDEWWKHKGGKWDEQDIEGNAPGGGPHPDQTFNEEWWGLVDIDRKPRPAYHALKDLWTK